MTVFDDALAHDIMKGQIYWEPTPNLAMQRLPGAIQKNALSRAEQRSKLAARKGKLKSGLLITSNPDLYLWQNMLYVVATKTKDVQLITKSF